MNVTVDEPEPGAVIEAGLNAAVVPEGSPEALRAMAELKLPEIFVGMFWHAKSHRDQANHWLRDVIYQINQA